jgi:tRNA-specific 2-thiouridylase
VTNKKKKAVIGMSGGVDSSVAAALLQQDGFDVIGVTMEIFNGSTTSSEGAHHACFGPGEQQDIEDARQVALKLGIPYYTVNLKQEYKRTILDFFVKEYRLGNTPNPCVKCNQELKFGAIGRELAKMGIVYDYFATGHYARIAYDEEYGAIVLKKALDRTKDQTYFLFNLRRDQLPKTLFPLGNMTKDEVRVIAKKLALVVSDKNESQDFVAGGYRQLFQKTGKTGPIVNREGDILGQHDGIENFTIGQRKGIGIAANEPLYVTSKDSASNTVIVGPKAELLGSCLVANNINWLVDDKLKAPTRLNVKIRFRHQEALSTVTPLENGEVRVEFDEPQSAIAPGQAIVFYNGDTVVGGGFIRKEIK